MLTQHNHIIVGIATIGDDSSRSYRRDSFSDRECLLDFDSQAFRGLSSYRDTPVQLRSPAHQIALMSGIFRGYSGILFLRRQWRRICLPLIFQPAVKLVQDYVTEDRRD